jgi:hypothetical protein
MKMNANNNIGGLTEGEKSKMLGKFYQLPDTKRLNALFAEKGITQGATILLEIYDGKHRSIGIFKYIGNDKGVKKLQRIASTFSRSIDATLAPDFLPVYHLYNPDLVQKIERIE